MRLISRCSCVINRWMANNQAPFCHFPDLIFRTRPPWHTICRLLYLKTDYPNKINWYCNRYTSWLSSDHKRERCPNLRSSFSGHQFLTANIPQGASQRFAPRGCARWLNLLHDRVESPTHPIIIPVSFIRFYVVVWFSQVTSLEQHSRGLFIIVTVCWFLQ